MEKEQVLEVEGLSSGYSGMQVLNNVNLHLSRGETLVILGPNGAGKTTLLKSIMGLIPLDGGKTLLRGRDVSRIHPSKRRSMGVAYVSEDTYFPTLTVLENLTMASIGMDKKDREKRLNQVYEVFPELKERAGSKVSSLSGGQRKFMIIGSVFMSKAEVILIDEPSGGLSPLYVEQIIDSLDVLKRAGRSILLAEQNVEFVSLADRLCILEEGTISFNGSPEEAEKNDSIRKSYFSL